MLQQIPSFVQGVQLPEGLKATGSMDELIEHTEIFLMVVPTPFVAATMNGIKDKLKPSQVSYLSPLEFLA